MTGIRLSLIVALIALGLSGCAFVGGLVNPCHKGDPAQQTTDCG